VLTDGRLYYGPKGEEWKVFDVRDGLGLKLARHAGLKVGFLSGRAGPALAARAKELEIDVLIAERPDKAAAYAEFLARFGTSPERVAFAGDDIVDLPVLGRCGLSFAPSDALELVRERVDCVLASRGGRGAAREMVEMILRARGAWDAVLAPFLSSSSSSSL
jgi:3-deoxy-D-manno-octulosonate 8-phosphate phosphatase (KDO 8-P phosphatase)